MGKILERSFAGGEISPQLFARVDLDKYTTGMSLCENAWVMPQGPVQNRPGFGFVQRTKFSDRATRLLPFSYNTEQTFALEFGDGYIRFHTQGGTLLEAPAQVVAISTSTNALFRTAAPHGYLVGQWVQLGDIPGWPGVSRAWGIVSSVPNADHFTLIDLWGAPISATGLPPFGGNSTVSRLYEVASPYSHTLLQSLNVVQSADVLTVTSPYYPPSELRRLGAADWTLDAISFSSSLSPPQSTGASPAPIIHHYAVQARVSGKHTEPGFTSVPNDLTIPGRHNVIGWNSVSGALTYFIFKRQESDGLYKLLGTAKSGNSFIDDGTIQPTDVVFYNGQDYPAPTVSATPVAPASDGVSVTPEGAGDTTYRYVVTSFSSERKEESIASGEGSAVNDLSVVGNFNTVRWPAVPGVSEYNVYRYSNGLWGFVGSAGSDCIFEDQNITPETSITPPIQTDPFRGPGDYPRAVSYYEQRRVFGGTTNQPQVLWMTRSGTEKNLGYSIPSRDDDGITMRVVAREAQTIRHIVPLNDMILLTSGGEWRVAASDGGALSPSTVSVKPQGYSGSSDVMPVLTSRSILFAQARGGRIRELQFSWEQQGYQTTDVSILAPHLFDYHAVVQMAFSRSPLDICWAVRDDGSLLGMTYVPEHEIRGWHRHTTKGAFESCCVVAEGEEDALYVVVRRTVRGQTCRYVERMRSRQFATAADQFFVDSGLTYVGPAVDEVAGLSHLEGETVAILADGGVSPPRVVTGGRVALDAPATTVHVGLPYTTRCATLPLALQAEAAGRGTRKNINKVFLRVLASNGFSAGPDFDHTRPVRTRGTEPFGSPPDLITGTTEISMDSSWNEDGILCFQQSDPLSFMVLGLVLDVATGG